MPFKGIDISEFQYVSSFEKLSKDVDFVIIRAGFGFSTIDKEFDRNIRNCIVNKIPFGIYWFIYATKPSEAEAEAGFCCALLKKYQKPDLPVYFDFEYDSENYAKKHGVTITAELYGKIATAFCEHVKSWGFTPGIYSNLDYKNRFGESITKKYSYWCACWSDNIKPDNKPVSWCDIWQFCSDGLVDGIDGDVDMDYCYIPLKQQEQTPVDYKDKEIDQVTNKYNKICKDIMRGKYGSGDERKKKLGKDYSIAQDIINEVFGVK